MSIHFSSSDDGSPVIEFPEEGVTANIPVTRVGEDLYRLDGVPFLVEAAGFRDVIEAEPAGDGRLWFRRVAERSGWRTFDFMLPSWKIEGEAGQLLLRRLEELGGHWERVLGGWLFVCIPPDLDLDPTEWAHVFGAMYCVV